MFRLCEIFLLLSYGRNYSECQISFIKYFNPETVYVVVIYHDTVENLDFLTFAVSHIEQNSVSESSASCIPFTVCSDSPNIGDQRYL